MISKLEARLAELEKTTPITNDEELICAIETIIQQEESRGFFERDLDLIDEAVKEILILRGVNTDKLEEDTVYTTDKIKDTIRQKEQRSQAQSPKLRFKLKWLVPIAAVIGILFTTTVGTAALEYNLWEDILSGIREKVFGPENIDMITTGEYYEYTTVEEMARDKRYKDILLPTSLSDEFTIEKISVQVSVVEDNSQTITEMKSIDILICSNDWLQELNINSPNVGYTLPDDTLRISRYDVWVVEGTKYFTGEFCYGGAVYKLRATSLKNLVAIIEALHTP